MQLLTLTVGGQTYALEARNVVEVLPLIPPRPVPLVPDYVLGVITYRGMLVPVIDLGLRLGHRGVETRLSTRLIVVEFVVPHRREQGLDIGPGHIGLEGVGGGQQQAAALADGWP